MQFKFKVLINVKLFLLHLKLLLGSIYNKLFYLEFHTILQNISDEV